MFLKKTLFWGFFFGGVGGGGWDGGRCKKYPKRLKIQKRKNGLKVCALLPRYVFGNLILSMFYKKLHKLIFSQLEINA